MTEKQFEYFDYETTQRELLRSLIAQPDMIPNVSKNIGPNDFSDLKYQSIYKAIFDLKSDNPDKDIQASEIANKINKDGYNFTKEDNYFLFNEDSLVEPPTELAEILKHHSVRTKAQSETEQLKKNLDDPASDLLEAMGSITKSFEGLSADLTKKEEITFVEQIENFDEMINSNEEISSIKSFYPSLDKYTGGWQPEQLITIAARTGIGKSVFGVNCALSAGLQNKKVLYFSLEMSYPEIIARFVASKSFIKINKMYPHSFLREDEAKLYSETIEELKKLPIVIDDSSNATLNYIRSKSIAESKKDGGLDLIIIDYIQLISTVGLDSRNRQEQVAEISRSLKMLAKQLKVPIMVVAQLNRESKDDEDRLPSKADIRESAAIAADSNIVIIIHRKYRDTSDDPKALFILDKNRNGPADKKIQVRCILDRGLFQDLSEEKEKKKQEEKEEDIFEEELSPETDEEDVDFEEDFIEDWGL